MRGIAIKALKIFQVYAKKMQTFEMVASEFNNKIDIVEKRAVFVALCKLGIPVRAVAKKYVDIDFAYCYYDKQKNQIIHTKTVTDLFTPGELNILTVFKLRSSWDIFFDENGKVILEKLDNLKKKIDLGIWDTYFFWDSESYLNIQTQNRMANVFTNAVLQNLEVQQKGQENKDLLDGKLDKIIHILSDKNDNGRTTI